MTRSVEARLVTFVDRVERTSRRRGIAEGTVRAHLSFSFDVDPAKTSLRVDLGDIEDLRSLLLDFRPFVSEKEDVFAPKVFNLLEKRLEDQAAIKANRENRSLWKSAMDGQMRIMVNSKTYKALDCLDLILNGDLFHLDADKSSELAALPEFMRMTMAHQVVTAVQTGVTILWATKTLIQQALSEGSIRLEDN